MLQNPAKTTINNKKALLCSRAFLLKPNNSDRQDPVYLARVNLLKFFPKYIHELRIEVEDRSTISKVKRVKILHGFHGYQKHTQSKNLRRTLLNNKEKYIQAFYDGDGPEFIDFKSMVQEIRAFTGLRTLKILAESHSSFGFKRICKYIRGLYQLKHLEFQINSEKSMRIISMINSYKRLLESLITLKIDCKWGSKWSRSPEDDIILLANLLKNKNILKSTTSLELGYLQGETFCELFESTLASCSKLGFILFESDCIMPAEKSQENSELPQTEDVKPLNSHYLQVLGTLNHLHTVNITCRNLFTFVRDFTLPLSIQNVKLKFSGFTSMMSLLGTPNNKNFKENLANFRGKWSHLTNLKTLNLTISQLGDKYLLTLMFLYSWLPRVRNLHHLHLELSSEFTSQSHWSELWKHEDTFDVSAFFQVIQHLKNTLQTLVISDNWLVYSIKNLPKQSFDFPHLQKLSLRGFMPLQEVDLSRLFRVNLKEVLSTKIEQPFELGLEGLDFGSMDAFMDFMKSFDYERNGPKRFVKMKMTAYVKSQTSKKHYLGRSFQCFTLQARGLSIQMEVKSDGDFEPNNDPELLLSKNLNFLRLKN